MNSFGKAYDPLCTESSLANFISFQGFQKYNLIFRLFRFLTQENRFWGCSRPATHTHLRGTSPGPFLRPSAKIFRNHARTLSLYACVARALTGPAATAFGGVRGVFLPKKIKPQTTRRCRSGQPAGAGRRSSLVVRRSQIADRRSAVGLARSFVRSRTRMVGPVVVTWVR